MNHRLLIRVHAPNGVHGLCRTFGIHHNLYFDFLFLADRTDLPDMRIRPFQLPPRSGYATVRHATVVVADLPGACFAKRIP